MTTSEYGGPAVFGYETDSLRRAAMISVHTSPLATLGGKDAGGMNVYVRELACHIARLGLPVDIYTRRTSPTTPEVQQICPGVNVITITAGPAAPVDKNQLLQYMPEFAAEAALYSLRNGVRYDVVHAHYWLSGWAAHLLKRYWNTPFLQMFHTTAHMKNAVSKAIDRETDQRAAYEHRLGQTADSLIAANPDERADLIWRSHTPPDKVCTVPPGVDIDLFQTADRATNRAKLGIDQDRPVILFVGRIDPIKGIDTLVDALELVHQQMSTVQLVLVGGDLDERGNPTGPLAVVRDDVVRRGLEGAVRFDGSQPQDQLIDYYAAANVVAVPSRYESFGLVAVEAMACSRPVVASRAGGLAFTVEEGVNGYLSPVGDAEAFAAALLRVLEDPSHAETLGLNGRTTAERFSWPVVASQILHIYQRLADGHRANLCCDEDIYA